MPYNRPLTVPNRPNHEYYKKEEHVEIAKEQSNKKFLDAELFGPVVEVWILETAFWEDAGVWMDEETWNDSL